MNLLTIKRHKKISPVWFLGSKQQRSNYVLFKMALLLFCVSFPFKPLQAQSSKIQQSIDAIKAAYYCEDKDYHTDGHRTVWVKSYKKWMPADFDILKKNAPDVIKFLSQAIQHNRMDVLEQLLPNYYRTHDGVQAFANDILKITTAGK